jgi:FtsP/CotA-like multicopper oxidase with cupredoxin domain
VTGTKRGARLPAPAPLAPNPVPRLQGLENAKTAILNMSGGAMGGMRQAQMGGKMMDIRELVENGRIWAFNGQVDLPSEPLLEAARGETVRITIENDTGWPHAMHLHGHHFRSIEPSGATGPLRDTVLMDRNETTEIAFVADNPGNWLLHCHMLEHAAGGMITWLKVR